MRHRARTGCKQLFEKRCSAGKGSDTITDKNRTQALLPTSKSGTSVGDTYGVAREREKEK